VNPYGFGEEKTFDLVLKSTQISNIFPLFNRTQKSTSAAKMPYPRHFFRSPSPELRQATIATSSYTHLSVRPPRPGPRPKPLERRRQEPAGSRQMMGGPNDITVTEQFRAYQHQFRIDHRNILGDDDNEVYRRCSYTREHKLAAIDFALNTWERMPDGRLEHVSKYYVSKRLRLHTSLLGRWIKNKHRILALKKGAQRLRLSKVGRHPELEKRLNQLFETARSTGRQITHRWFLR
jgi:hypothetical protein